MTAPAVEVHELSRSCGASPVLRAVSFTVAAGEHTALLGASGSGKTTVLRLLAGLDAPDGGWVRLGGAPASLPGRILVPPHRRGIGMVFQDLALWPNLSVFDNVRLGLAGDEGTPRAQEALALCGVADLAARRPGAISGGQQQRVALARAVATGCTLLVLDEPFAGLDLVTKDRLLAEVAGLADRRGFTILLATHDPTEARRLCPSAVVLADGAVAEAGPWDRLLADPRSELLRAFRSWWGGSRPAAPGGGFPCVRVI